MADNNENISNQTATNESRITIHKIYTKAQQFIVNGLPDELSKNWSPQLSIQANPRVTPLKSGQHEVVLTLNLSAQQLGKAIFQVQVDQAGLFTLQNVPADQQETALYGACPNVLFSYAAVMVNQALSQAGLPQVYLNPLDFIALYHEHKEQERQKKQEQAVQEVEVVN